MELTVFDPQSNAYSQASLVSDHTRLLFISGQVPESPDSKCPDNFEDQCRLVWGNGIYDPAWLLEIEAIAAA